MIILKGTLIDTETPAHFTIREHSYLVGDEQGILGIYEELPERFAGYPIEDYQDQIIIPGLCDLHLHAPQYAFRGLGRNIDSDGWGTWFDLYAFPEESHYRDLQYAHKAYQRFVDDLMKTTTTRAVVFATIHRPATELLMALMEEKGFAGYVGKVNMDRNSREGLIETLDETLFETEQWILDCQQAYPHIKPIITPRYLPTCTKESLDGLGQLAAKYQVPVQSHLSEGLDELDWVKELEPTLSCYGEAYDRSGLLGSCVPSLMAHCVYPNEAEFALLKQRNVTIAHCPECNMFAAGLAPIRDYLDAGIHVGLGTDMAGVGRLELFQVIKNTILASRLRWGITERTDGTTPMGGLTWSEAFYLASKGGGSFFGKAGSFEPGYAMDAVVLDDSALADLNPRTPLERLERLIQMSDDRQITAKYINGHKIS